MLSTLTVYGGINIYRKSHYAVAKKKDGCHPDYSGCLKKNATDYDGKGGNENGPYYTGRVIVKKVGHDPLGLDRDHDGMGCECSA